MQGFDLNTQRQVTRKTPFLHYSDENVEIRSSHAIESILEVPIINTILPGNLSSYIYPEGSVIYLKKNVKLKELFKEYDRAVTKRSNLEAAIFDVPQEEETEDIHDEEVEEEEFDEEEDEENEGEEELWEEEDDERDVEDEVPED